MRHSKRPIYGTETLQFLQGGAGPRVPTGVLHGAGRDAGVDGLADAVGGLRGVGLLQVHGSLQRGGQGLLHRLRIQGRARVRLPLLPRR